MFNRPVVLWKMIYSHILLPATQNIIHDVINCVHLVVCEWHQASHWALAWESLGTPVRRSVCRCLATRKVISGQFSRQSFTLKCQTAAFRWLRRTWDIQNFQNHNHQMCCGWTVCPTPANSTEAQQGRCVWGQSDNGTFQGPAASNKHYAANLCKNCK